MKHRTPKTIGLASVFLALGLGSAQAKDWIEKVRISPGSDTVPVQIMSDGNQYTLATKPTHTFKLESYAKAKSGKRIFYAFLAPKQIHDMSGVMVGGKPISEHAYVPQYGIGHTAAQIGYGQNRTWSYNASYKINLGKVNWDDLNPQQACNALLTRKIKQGQPKHVVLSQLQTTQVKAKFHLRAAAARPGNAAAYGSGQYDPPFYFKQGTYTQEGSATQYTVFVDCLPSKLNNEDTLQQPQTSANVPNRNGDKLIKALPVIIGIGTALSGGSGGRTPGR
jgi:hypothetical protein